MRGKRLVAGMAANNERTDGRLSGTVVVVVNLSRRRVLTAVKPAGHEVSRSVVLPLCYSPHFPFPSISSVEFQKIDNDDVFRSSLLRYAISSHHKTVTSYTKLCMK